MDTFVALAAQAPPDAAVLDVLADAQQENVYVQRYARGQGGEVQAASPVELGVGAEDV